MANGLTFKWHDDAQVFVRDQPVDPNTSAPIGTLLAAIRDGLEFRVAPDAITALPTQGSGAYFECMTSGTTGNPKAIRRSHASWIHSFEANRARFALSSTDSYAVFGQLAHSLALYAVLEAAHIGANIHLLADMRPDRQAQSLGRNAVSVLYATPTQLRALCGSEPLPAVRHILCGGGQLAPQMRPQIKALCPNATLSEFYGASETSFITMSDSDTPAGSVGQAYDSVELSIRDTDQTSGVGEVWVKSPYLFDSYAIGDSAETRSQDGFVTVGELGALDKAGNLFLKGRKSRMVTIADQNVFLDEVEALLLSDPGVTHCAVLPRPDEIRGSVLWAVIGGPPDDVLKNRLTALCRQNLGTLTAPRKILFMNDLPALPAGKPDIVKIAKWLEAQE